MNVLLVAALFAQLNSFDFAPVGGATAGDSFSIVVVARDASGDTFRQYSGWAFLRTSRDGVRQFYADPPQINFFNGVCSTQVVVWLAADTIRLKCTDPTGAITSASQPFNVAPNRPVRYVTLLPNQWILPGSKSDGRYGTPFAQTCGVPCSLVTWLTDNWFNPVSLLRNDSLRLACSDPFAEFTWDPHLTNGKGEFAVTLRRAGVDTVFTYPRANLAIKADTSSPFDVLRGTLRRIVPILPGEALQPGDTATAAFRTPGKAGRPDRQYVKRPFLVKVLATDSTWNQVPVPPDSILLYSDFAWQCTLLVASDTGYVFQVSFDSAGDNQTIWAKDLSRGLESYRCLVNVEAATESISVLLVRLPHDTLYTDTIWAGETIRLYATYFDPNFKPIPGKWCQFRVTTGHGELSDSLNITDTSGATWVDFLCAKASNSEEDTVEFAADGFAFRTRIFIQTDPDVQAGKIVAFPNPLGLDDNRVTIEYYLPGSCDGLAVSIYDPFGNIVCRQDLTRHGQEGNRAGVNRIYWYGRRGTFEEHGPRVASGIYIVKIRGLVFTSKLFERNYRIGVLW
jgi:hypothetical protein